MSVTGGQGQSLVVTVYAPYSDRSDDAVTIGIVDPSIGMELSVHLDAQAAHDLAMRLVDCVFINELDRFINKFAANHMTIDATQRHQMILAFRMELERRGRTDGGQRAQDLSADDQPA